MQCSRCRESSFRRRWRGCGLICYTIQIYFDFSGYSDMAIGLARMLGFGSRKISITLMFRNPSPEFCNAGISPLDWLRDYLFSRLGRELAR